MGDVNLILDLGTQMDEEFDHRVARGAALLDAALPGWEWGIELDALAMERCDHCMLGQLYGDYLNGFRKVLADQPAQTLFSAAAHGFTLLQMEQEQEPDTDGDSWYMSYTQANARFRRLADAWRRLIRARRR